MPAEVPESFGGFQPVPPPKGSGELLPVFEQESPELRAWRETNVRPQKQAGYSIVTATVPQGNLTGDQMRGLADLSEQAGDGSLRFSMNQNVVLAWVPGGSGQARLRRVDRTGLSRRGRRRNQRRHHLSGRV